MARDLQDQITHVLELPLGDLGSRAHQHGGQDNPLIFCQGLKGPQLLQTVLVYQATANALVQLFSNLDDKLRVGFLICKLGQGDLVSLFLPQSLLELGHEVEVQVTLGNS